MGANLLHGVCVAIPDLATLKLPGDAQQTLQVRSENILHMSGLKYLTWQTCWREGFHTPC
jgi:hypothetical protein